MLLSGFSGQFMASSMFRCAASAVYQGFFFGSRPQSYFGSGQLSASPNQNKTLAPHQKTLINCFCDILEHPTVHKIPTTA